MSSCHAASHCPLFGPWRRVPPQLLIIAARKAYDPKVTCLIGEPPYLSTLPLCDPLRRDPEGRFRLVPAPMHGMLDMLLDGGLDVAPVTPLQVLHHPGKVKVLPAPVLSSMGRSGCVMLFSRQPAYALAEARIAVPESQPEAVQLLRYLLTAWYGLSPTLVPRGTGLEESLTQADGVLFFQDLALEAQIHAQEGIHVWDLGEAWWQLTQTPLTYLQWAVRGDTPDDRVKEIAEAWSELRREHPLQPGTLKDRGAHLPDGLVEGYLARFVLEPNPAHDRGLAFYAQHVVSLGHGVMLESEPRT